MKNGTPVPNAHPNVFHYYGTTVYGWEVGEDLYQVLTKLRRNHTLGQPKGTRYAVLRVPLPIEALYEIENYIPKVPGTEHLAHGIF